MTASRKIAEIEVAEVLYKPPDFDRLFAVIRRHVRADDQPNA